MTAPSSRSAPLDQQPREALAFRALCRPRDQLIGEAGASVVLIGASEERGVSAEVAGRMSHTPLVLTGETTLA